MRFDPGLPDERVNVSPEHPVREAAVLVGGIVAIAVATVAAVALAVDRLVPLVPPRLEARLLGDAMVDALLDEGAGGAPDPRTAAATGLLQRVAAHWPDAPYEFRLALLDRSAANAMALPGGLIVVTTGLLDGVASENELAFVLGHELGHFRHRDHLRGLGRGLALALLTGALHLSGAGGAAQLAALSGSLADRSFGREQERRADRFGLALVQAEYGHVAGAADFFEHVPDPAPGAASAVGDWLSTHPLDDDRVADLEAVARDNGWPTRGTTVPVGPPTPAH